MYFTHGKVTLHYEIYGNGYPLIMLHGNGEDITIFSKAIEKLESAFTIYAIDTRGHGKSSPVHEYHYSDMADDLYAFITELGIGRPAIFGFSDGGITALMLAYTHPEIPAAIIACGANSCPKGIKALYRFGFDRMYRSTKDPRLAVMLYEPDMTAEKLGRTGKGTAAQSYGAYPAPGDCQAEKEPLSQNPQSRVLAGGFR